MSQTHAAAVQEQGQSRAARTANDRPSAHASRPFPRAAGHELDRVARQRALAGPGQPIDPVRRARAEDVTGVDLSGVRLRTGPAVRVAARAAGASAFTVGGDIAIAVGPDEAVPERLLTHELVHAAQQRTPGAATPAQAELQARAVDSGAGSGVLLGTRGGDIDYAATDWLEAPQDVSSYGDSALFDELNEVDGWLSRQISSSPDVDRMQSAKIALEAEINHRFYTVRTEVDGYRIGPVTRPRLVFDEDFDYNSDLPTAADYLQRTKWGVMLLGGQLHPGLDDATSMYAHYLDASGEPRTFDLEEAIAEDAKIASFTEGEITRTAAAVDRLTTGRDNFNVTGPAHGTPDSPSTENWQKTIGRYQQWSSATVSVTNGTVTMEITVHAEDRYNFNRGQSDIATGAPDNANGRFQEIGWARSFNTSGAVTRTVSWPVGTPPSSQTLEGGPERNRFGRDSREDRPDR